MEDKLYCDITNDVRIDIKSPCSPDEKDNNLCLFIIGSIYNINLRELIGLTEQLVKSCYKISVISLISNDLSPNCLSPRRSERRRIQIKNSHNDHWNELLKKFSDNDIRYVVETYSSEKDIVTEEYPNIKKYIKDSCFDSCTIGAKDSFSYQMILELISFSIMEKYELDNSICFNTFIKTRPDYQTSDLISDKICNIDRLKNIHFQVHDVLYITNRNNLNILKNKIMYLYRTEKEHTLQERYKYLDLIYEKRKDKFSSVIAHHGSSESCMHYNYSHFINIFVLEYYNKEWILM